MRSTQVRPSVLPIARARCAPPLPLMLLLLLAAAAPTRGELMVDRLIYTTVKNQQYVGVPIVLARREDGPQKGKWVALRKGDARELDPPGADATAVGHLPGDDDQRQAVREVFEKVAGLDLAAAIKLLNQELAGVATPDDPIVWKTAISPSGIIVRTRGLCLRFASAAQLESALGTALPAEGQRAKLVYVNDVPEAGLLSVPDPLAVVWKAVGRPAGGEVSLVPSPAADWPDEAIVVPPGIERAALRIPFKVGGASVWARFDEGAKVAQVDLTGPAVVRELAALGLTPKDAYALLRSAALCPESRGGGAWTFEQVKGVVALNTEFGWSINKGDNGGQRKWVLTNQFQRNWINAAAPGTRTPGGSDVAFGLPEFDFSEVGLPVSFDEAAGYGVHERRICPSVVRVELVGHSIPFVCVPVDGKALYVMGRELTFRDLYKLVEYPDQSAQQAWWRKAVDRGSSISKALDGIKPPDGAGSEGPRAASKWAAKEWGALAGLADFRHATAGGKDDRGNLKADPKAWAWPEAQAEVEAEAAVAALLFKQRAEALAELIGKQGAADNADRFARWQVDRTLAEMSALRGLFERRAVAWAEAGLAAASVNGGGGPANEERRRWFAGRLVASAKDTRWAGEVDRLSRQYWAARTRLDTAFPSRAVAPLDQPLTQVPWTDLVAVLKIKAEGSGLRLPTADEWWTAAEKGRRPSAGEARWGGDRRSPWPVAARGGADPGALNDLTGNVAEVVALTDRSNVLKTPKVGLMGGHYRDGGGGGAAPLPINQYLPFGADAASPIVGFRLVFGRTGGGTAEAQAAAVVGPDVADIPAVNLLYQVIFGTGTEGGAVNKTHWEFERDHVDQHFGGAPVWRADYLREVLWGAVGEPELLDELPTALLVDHATKVVGAK